MKTANEYRYKQVLSLKDEIATLQVSAKMMKQEQTDWKSQKKEREDGLAALDKATFAAKEAHNALLKSHDAELEDKRLENERLTKANSLLIEWHSHQAAEKSVELLGHDQVISERKKEIEKLAKQETELNQSLVRLSTDKVLALKDTAKALDDHRKSVEKLNQIKARIAQGERDWLASEAGRIAQAKDLTDWQERLSTRDNDLQVLVSRIKPDYVKLYGENTLNKKVFEPSR